MPMVIVVTPCKKEIDSLPVEVREDLADALARLENALMLSMPLSRPMFAIEKGLYELRLKDRAGTYRVFYLMKRESEIFLLCAFKKTTQQTPKHVIATIKRRMMIVR